MVQVLRHLQNNITSIIPNNCPANKKNHKKTLIQIIARCAQDHFYMNFWLLIFDIKKVNN